MSCANTGSVDDLDTVFSADGGEGRAVLVTGVRLSAPGDEARRRRQQLAQPKYPQYRRRVNKLGQRRAAAEMKRREGRQEDLRAHAEGEQSCRPSASSKGHTRAKIWPGKVYKSSAGQEYVDISFQYQEPDSGGESVPDLVSGSDDESWQFERMVGGGARSERMRQGVTEEMQVYLREPCIHGGFHSSWATYFGREERRGVVSYPGCAPCGCDEEPGHCKDACTAAPDWTTAA